MLSKEMMECMYGNEAGETKGSPEELIGKRRDKAEDRDLKNIGMLSGYTHLSMR